MKIFIAPAAIIIFGSPVDVSAQCQNLTYDKSLFDAVSAEYREKLLDGFEAFFKNKCEENFAVLYEMMPEFFREVNPKDEFVKNMQFYYSGKDRFVSFIPQMVGEYINPETKKPHLWHIDGCLAEVINSKRRSFIKILEVQTEKGKIVFTDITTQPNPLGYKHKKCKS